MSENIIYGEGGGGGCFMAGTQILLENGKYKNIEELIPGDIILSYNQYGDVELDTVEKLHIHEEPYPIYKIKFWKGEVYSTLNHWVLNQYNSFVEIGSLTIEDAIIDSLGHLRPILSKEFFKLDKVYNLTVSKNHTFIANNIRVHNGGHRVSYPIIYGEGGGGGGKGGGGSSTPRAAVESPNTLKSTQIAEVIDVISEGEIEGLVDGANSVFLDDVPLSEYTGYKLESRTGTQTQTAVSAATRGILNSKSTSTTPILYGPSNAKVITVTDPLVKQVIIQISVPSLYQQNTINGDMLGSTIAFKISTKPQSSGTYIDDIFTEIQGKCTSLYKQDYAVSIARYTSAQYPIDIKIERTKADSTSAAVQDSMYCGVYTEVQPDIFRYPNTALISLKLDSDNFSSIPTRGYDIKGIKVKVPTNYNTTTRNYTGEWDGTFKIAWTDNPAWVFYDIVTDTRYGIGNNVPEAFIDKWSLYSIARYCDGVDSNGNYTGVKSGFKNANGTDIYEPRFTCNICIQTQNEAYKVLNDIASIFRGMQYWATGQLIVSADIPKDPVAQFSPANVIDGVFNYSGSSAKTRHTAVKVTWNDPSDAYRQKIEYVEANGFSTGYNPIDKHGVVQTETIAIGCTSRGQANRVGRWLLYTELLETETVSFKTGLEHARVYPGAIIQTTDPFRGGERLGGRVQSISSSGIELDGEVADGIDYYLSLVNTTPNLSFTGSISGYTLTVSNISIAKNQLKVGLHISGNNIPADTYITAFNTGSGGLGTYTINKSLTVASQLITATLQEPNIETRSGSVLNNIFILDTNAQSFTSADTNMLWLLSKPAQEPEYWRVISITEDGPSTANIVALEYNPDKFAAIEDGLILEERPVSQIDTSRPDTPTNLSIQEHLYYSSPSVYSTAATISWTGQAKKYMLKYCSIINNVADYNWNVIESYTPMVEIKPIGPGTYQFQLEAVNAAGRKSAPLITNITILGVMAPPMDVSDFVAEKSNGIMLSWRANNDNSWAYPDIDLNGYEIREIFLQELSEFFTLSDKASFPTWAINYNYNINDNIKITLSGTTRYFRCIQAHQSSSTIDLTKWSESIGSIRWKTLAEVRSQVGNQSLTFSQYVAYLNSVWNSYSNNKVQSGLIYEASYRDSIAATGYNIYLIKAIDKSNNPSSIPTLAGVIVNRPPAVESITYEIGGENLEIKWIQPTPDIAIKNYEVKYLDNKGTEVTTITQTSYLSKKLWFSGFTEYLTIQGVDFAGNRSDIRSFNITLPAISPPINIQKEFIGENYKLSWTPPSTSNNTPSLSKYDVVYLNGSGGEVLVTSINSTSYSSKVSWTDSRTFRVYSVDTVGNRSTSYAEVQIQTPTPSKPLNIVATVIDNNVLLKWEPPASGMELPLSKYILKKGSTWDSGEVLGTINGEFSTVFETINDTYTYWLAAVNSAGKEGTPDQRSATVNQPPDYFLINNYYSDFTTPYGDSTNNPGTSITSSNAHKILSGELVLPIDTSQTWTSHFTSNSKTAFTNFGAIPYITPGSSSGYYQEIIDYGTTIDASSITITFNSTNIYGNPSIIFEVWPGSGNPSSIVWGDKISATKAFFTNFRYVKIRVSVSGGVISARELNVRIDVKRRSISKIHTHTIPEVSFSGNISGTTLTVNSISNNGIVRVGQVLSATNMSNNTTITGLLTGTGGIGTYTVNNSQSRSEQNITATDPDGSIVYLTDDGKVTGTRLFTDIQSISLTPAYSATAKPIAIYNYVDVPTPTYFKILMYDSDTGDRIGGTCSYTVTGV